jgi:transposase
VNRKTIRSYLDQFEQIRKHYPSKLNDFEFFMPDDAAAQRSERLYRELISVLPNIISTHRLPQLDPLYIWNIYREHCHDGYAFYLFRMHFGKWCKANKIATYYTKLIVAIPEADRAIMNKWRKGSDKRSWQIAVTLDAAYHRKSLEDIRRKIEANLMAMYGWIDAYRADGLAGLVFKPRVQNEAIAAAVTEKSARIIALMHESPGLHGINKAAWTTGTLAETYRKLYGSKISGSNISKYLKKLGYHLKSSRQALTSPDPEYAEKLQKIKDTLARLESDEKFFSIDEYGPIGMKLKGGRSFMQDSEPQKTISQLQSCRGYIICIAALELSKNQVSHFFALEKTGAEMIKLIDLLVSHYKDQRTLYLLWDDVSFHKGKNVKARLAQLNTTAYRADNNSPAIVVVPLPTSATFLNVIESVFIGMARSTIRNSDYSGPDECMQAIDLYFKERNAHFLENPKQAGNKIWGKETMTPKFSEFYNSKNLNT